MNEKLLGDIGLTKGEIKVYLTLLKIGETTTGKIIDQAQISSGKIYEILDKLMKKGLVSYILKDKTKYFQASTPKRILDYLHNKEKDLKQKEKQVENMMPALLEMQKYVSNKYEVRLYEGFKGYQTAIQEGLNDLTHKDEVLANGLVSNKPSKFNIGWKKWHKERVKRKIKCRMLFSEISKDYYNHFKNLKFTKTRKIQGLTPAAATIMGQRVLIFTHGDPPSVLSIKHPDIVQSFRTFFNTLWKQAKP